jgi:hypothetical protein
MDKKPLPVFLGLSKSDAFRILGKYRIPYRITIEDDTHYLMSQDIRIDRVNLTIHNGIITAYEFY